MPKQYESMREKFMQQGLSKKDAQAKAAKIYNAAHPRKPVGSGKK